MMTENNYRGARVESRVDNSTLRENQSLKPKHRRTLQSYTDIPKLDQNIKASYHINVLWLPEFLRAY